MFPSPSLVKERKSRRMQSSPFLDEEITLALLSPLADLPDEEQYPHLLSFYSRLTESDVLIPLVGLAQMPFVRLAFTHEAAFRAWNSSQDIDALRLPFLELCKRVIEQGETRLIINLSGPYGCAIEAGDLLYLQNGFLPPPRLGV
jgi:hypothetical protein